MIELALFMLGLLVTTVFTMVGLAGGLLIVPILILGFGLPAQQAVGVSLMMMTFATLSATIAYARQRRINYRVGVLLDVLDVPGALVGAWLTTLIASNLLAGLFGAFLLIVSIFVIMRKNEQTTDVMGIKRRILGLPVQAFYFCLLASFASGAVAGMFGAGGGTVDMAAMILMLRMSPYIAVGTSEFGMALTNTAALIPHAFLGNVALGYAVPLAAGAVVGAQIGPTLSRRAKVITLRKILGLVFIIIGLRMIIVPYISA